jgi:signal transduction histidine kinase
LKYFYILQYIIASKKMTLINTGAKERMNEIYKITSILTHSQFNDFEEILKIACEFLGIGSGIVSSIKDAKYTVLDHYSNDDSLELTKNKVYELDQTFSSVTLAEGKVVSINNSETSPYKDHAFFKNSDIKVYIGVPICINNEVLGTLSFYSKTERSSAFTQADEDFVQYLGEWISNFLHKSYYEKQIADKNEQLKKLNLELEKNNDKLSKSIQEKEHLSQILVHDLKSPLSNIQMLSFLFEELITDKESEELLIIFNKSLQDVFHLIYQMETLNDVENTFIKLYLEEIDINNFLKEQVEAFSKTAAVKNINIQFSESPDLGKIITDVNVLKRVISNLISNAIKFSEFNKEIKIEAYKTECRVMIDIADQGPGFKLEEKDKLFKRFSKLSAKPTNNESSSGLGLYIVKELLEKLNSSISLESVRGEGSTFTISLATDLNHPD